MAKICPKCGAKIDDKAFACDKCGSFLELDMDPVPSTPHPVGVPLPGISIPKEDKKNNKD